MLNKKDNLDYWLWEDKKQWKGYKQQLIPSAQCWLFAAGNVETFLGGSYLGRPRLVGGAALEVGQDASQRVNLRIQAGASLLKGLASRISLPEATQTCSKRKLAVSIASSLSSNFSRYCVDLSKVFCIFFSTSYKISVR